MSDTLKLKLVEIDEDSSLTADERQRKTKRAKSDAYGLKSHVLRKRKKFSLKQERLHTERTDVVSALHTSSNKRKRPVMDSPLNEGKRPSSNRPPKRPRINGPRNPPPKQPRINGPPNPLPKRPRINGPPSSPPKRSRINGPPNLPPKPQIINRPRNRQRLIRPRINGPPNPPPKVPSLNQHSKKRQPPTISQQSNPRLQVPKTLADIFENARS